MTSLISVADAKTWLRYPNPSSPSADDAAIQGVIDAATEIIELWTGPVVERTLVEKYDGGNASIWLRNAPVIGVSEVIESWGYTRFSLDYVDPDLETVTSIYAYSLDNQITGEITRRSVGGVAIPFMSVVPEGVQVTYRAGRQTPPAATVLAAKELVAHIWQSAEQRGVSASQMNVQYDATMGMNIHNPSDGTQLFVGVPARIMQLLESERRMPVMA